MSFKIDIIAGFLGAGKTTLIQKLLREGVFAEQIAIIENEFGEVGIDGSVLQETGIAVREINAGCICCSMGQAFSEADLFYLLFPFPCFLIPAPVDSTD